MQLPLPIAVAALTALVGTALATSEIHTVRIVNHCDTGTPKLVVGGKILSNGTDFTSDGPLRGAVVYLQTGVCGISGSNCTIIDTTLENLGPGPGVNGSLTSMNTNGTSKFNVAARYVYFNGCYGVGAICTNSTFGCFNTYRSCMADDVNLSITFCPT